MGDSVWYRGERYWVTRAPADWSVSHFVRISDKRVREDSPEVKDSTSFFVHPDLLDLAPVNRNPYGRQPTMADVKRREVQRTTGLRDNGDEVAELLRSAKTLDDVYRIGARFLGVKEAELRAKYEKLNPGQQRMCVGNRMRGKAKTGK